MTEHSPRPFHVVVQKSDIGMSRLFSAANLDRHRKLASNVIGVAERHQVLADCPAHISNILIREPDAHSVE